MRSGVKPVDNAKSRSSSDRPPSGPISTSTPDGESVSGRSAPGAGCSISRSRFVDNSWRTSGSGQPAFTVTETLTLGADPGTDPGDDTDCNDNGTQDVVVFAFNDVEPTGEYVILEQTSTTGVFAGDLPVSTAYNSAGTLFIST